MASSKAQPFVLTGATGFLGSHLMAALLERGERVVVLGRGSGGKSLDSRVRELLAWFCLEERGGQVEAVEVDLLEPLCGLDRRRYDALCAAAGPIIHCASDTRFSERFRLESVTGNVDSLRGIIAFARDSCAPFFHYVSTAYAAGISSGTCREAPVSPERFCNVYEETKARAEGEVVANCTEHAIPYTIIRPAIVYGDSRTGRANRFTALYTNVKSLSYLGEIYRGDIREHGGGKARQCGIRLDDNGILHLPLRVVVPQPGTINLVPIDYFVSAALSIVAHGATGSIYHLTSDAPNTLEELASYCESFLKLKGIEVVYGGQPPDYTPPEALFNRFVEPYLPYLSDTRVFDRSNTNAATAGLVPPAFTYDVFERCMTYAVASNWGTCPEARSTGRGKKRQPAPIA
jgi:nucleoside-diphosphate-sugar epimerase